MMSFIQMFTEELDREAARTRRALEQVPLGRDDWKPHPKSMPLGRLAGLVASMPSWVTLIIDQDELKLTQTLDGHLPKARESLSTTTDEYLMTTNWRLLAGGQVVMTMPRHIVLRD